MAILLLEKGADINARNDLGNTPLHEAAWHGHLNVTELLVQKGADLTAKAVDGKTPVELAVKGSHSEVCEFLDRATQAGSATIPLN